MRHRSFGLSSLDPRPAFAGLLAGLGIGGRKTRTHDALETMSRIGFAANGFVYLSVGTLMIAAAIGMRGQPVGTEGAVSILAGQPYGRFWLMLVGSGLWAFVGWRALQAIFDADREGSDLKGWAARLGQAFSGLAYAVLASGVFELLDEVGPAMDADDMAENQEKAAMVLGLPFGGPILIAIGLGIAAAGVANIVRGSIKDFAADLECSANICRRVLPLARFGYIARGLAYLPLALFVVLAGWRAQASQVETFGSSLDALQNQPGGSWMLGVTGLGMIAFGAYSFVEARYRRIRPPRDLKPR